MMNKITPYVNENYLVKSIFWTIQVWNQLINKNLLKEPKVPTNKISIIYNPMSTPSLQKEELIFLFAK